MPLATFPHTPRLSRLFSFFALLLAASLLLAAPSQGASAKASEYEVKAGFLYNFLNFITWPQPKEEPSSPYVIALYAKGDALATFERVLAGETVKGRPIKLLVLPTPDEAAQAHLVFFSRDFQDQENILARLAGQPVVTVGETPTFIGRGGIINLVTKENKVRFQINPGPARAAGVSISSHLLRLAIITGNSSRDGSSRSAGNEKQPSKSLASSSARGIPRATKPNG